MNGYFKQFVTGIDQRAKENNGIVEMNRWFYNLAFDVSFRGALNNV
jgi:hypothetical protein